MSQLPTPYAQVHKPGTTKGPGDARPTAIQIIEDQGLVGKLSDTTAVVTGANSGIGIETARALYVAGAKVYITSRTLEKAKAAAETIITESKGTGSVEVLGMELDNLDSVRAAAKDFLSKEKKLNILINNAGVMVPPYSKTKDGFELQFGTNHVGHFLFFQLLKPTLLASASSKYPSRVVSVSSVGHIMGGIRFDDYNFDQPDSYEPWPAYAQSKTANIYFANEIERLYGSQNLHAFSLHPGGIFTGLQKHVPAERMQGWRDDPNVNNMMKSPAQGAATSIWAATSKELEGKGGIYLEDCSQAHNKDDADKDMLSGGVASHAYNEVAEARLWRESNKMVGFPEDH